MRLTDTLLSIATAQESPFRAHLLREDVERLRKLQTLARSASDLASFKNSGMRVSWTAGDLRTHELRAPLEALLEAVYAYETGATGAAAEERIEAAWRELHRTRLERLVGCLSTPVPKPTD